MIQQTSITKKALLLTPIFGTVAFVVLYVVATILYPGGSQADKNAVGFSWVNNYWCNLLNENAINGQYNDARPFAMAGMFVLCATLTIFWLLFPLHTEVSKTTKLIIQISGTLAMAIACCLFTTINHDLVTNLASLFGLIAAVATFMALYNNRWYVLFSFGLFNILLVALNNYVYYNQPLIVYLPVIQKISFASFLIWICCINVHIFQQAIKKGSQQVQGYSPIATIEN